MKRFLKLARKKSVGQPHGPADGRSLSSSHGSSASVSEFPAASHLGYSIEPGDLKDKAFTKLHSACWQNDIDKVKKHIKKHDVNTTDKDRRTPLHLACAVGSKDVIWFLLNHKANIEAHDKEGNTPLLKAIQCHHLHVVQFLLERGCDANCSDRNQRNGLHLAVIDNLLDIASLLLDKGTNVDAVDKEGKSPLHLATEHNHVDFIELLLRHGASVNAQDNQSLTCLMIACKLSSKKPVDIFLEYGANLALADSNGWTAEKYAETAGQKEIVEILQRHKGKFQPFVQNEEDKVGETRGIEKESANPANRQSPSDNSLLDSWSDDSEEFKLPKKKIIPGLNLAKFMSSLDISDKDLTDSETKEIPSPIKTGPPKPPRSQVFTFQVSDASKLGAANASEEVPSEKPQLGHATDDDCWDSDDEKSDEIKGLGVNSVSKIPQDESPTKVPITSEQNTQITQPTVLNSSDSKDNFKELKEPTETSPRHTIAEVAVEPKSEISIPQSPKENDEIVRKEEQVVEATDLMMGASRMTRSMKQENLTEIKAQETNATLKESPVMKNLEKNLSEGDASGQAGVAPESIHSHDENHIKPSQKESESTPIIKEQDLERSDNMAGAKEMLQIPETKPRLYRKKSDSSISRHIRTPSGNYMDLHPLADLSNRLSDSEDDSRWSTDEEIPLTDNDRKTTSQVPLSNEENKGITNEVNELDLPDKLQKSPGKENHGILVNVALEDDVDLSLSIKDDDEPLDRKIQDLQPLETKEEIKIDQDKSSAAESSADNSVFGDFKDDKDFSFKSRFEDLKNQDDRAPFNETPSTHFHKNGTQEMATVVQSDVIPEFHLQEEPHKQKTGTDGTLGRLDTLLGMDEVWERNASLELSVAEGDNLSIGSKSEKSAGSLTNSLKRGLFRQDAVKQDDPKEQGEDEIITERLLESKSSVNVDASGKNDEITKMPKTTKADTILMVTTNVTSEMSQKPQAIDSPQAPVRKRSVIEIREHFEGLSFSLPTMTAAKQWSATKVVTRKMSLSKENLENVLRPKMSHNNADKGKKPGENLNILQQWLPNSVTEHAEHNGSRRRHSIAVPIITPPPGISFKQLLQLRHLESFQTGSGSTESIESQDNEEIIENKKHDVPADRQKPTDLNNKSSKKQSKLFSFLGKNKPDIKKQNPPMTLPKPFRATKDLSSLSQDSNNNTPSKREKSFRTLPLEKFSGIKRLTKRLSLSLDTKTKSSLEEKMLSRSLSNSFENNKATNKGSLLKESISDINSEEKEDFVKDVLQRLDIRRRSSIGIFGNVIAETLKAKKLSQSSSLEKLSESNSSISTDSNKNDDISNAVSERKQNFKEMHEYISDDDDDDDLPIPLDAFDTKIALIKQKEPQAYLKLQDFVRELRVCLERESGERQLLEEHLKVLTCEQNELRSQAENMHKRHTELQEQVVEMESQLNLSQWEITRTKEEKKTCENKLHRLLENLNKKDENLLKEVNLRQQSEFARSNLENELSTVSENLHSLYDECRTLQRQVSDQSFDCENKQVASVACNTNMEPSASANHVESKIYEQLHESRQLCERLHLENQALQQANLDYQQNCMSLQRKLKELEMSAIEKEKWVDELDSTRNELRISEEALKQATLSYMAQIQTLQTENKDLQSKIEDDQCHACNKITSLAEQLKTAQTLTQSTVAKYEEQKRLHLAEKDELETSLLRAQNENSHLLQHKQEVASRLSSAHEKISLLEKLLNANNSEMKSPRLDQFNDQMMKLQNELFHVKDQLTNINNNYMQTSPLISDAGQMTCKSSPSPQHCSSVPACESSIVRQIVEQMTQTHAVEDVNILKLSEVEIQLQSREQDLEQIKGELEKKRLMISTLEKKFSESLQQSQQQLELILREKEEMQHQMNQFQQDLQITQTRLRNSELNLGQAEAELEVVQKKAESLDSAVLTNQEVARKWEKDHVELAFKWRSTCKELTACVQRESDALAALHKTENLFQEAKRQIEMLEMDCESKEQKKDELEVNLFETKSEVQTIGLELHSKETENLNLFQKLQEKEKREKEMEAQIAQLRLENAQFSECLQANSVSRMQQSEMDARELEWAAKAAELEKRLLQNTLALEEQQRTTLHLKLENKELQNLLEVERNRKSFIKEATVFSSLEQEPAKKEKEELGFNYPVPKEFLEQIKDLKKQAEELKIKVKLEKDHRHRCEAQLTKAKKELNDVPRLRKTISHLEQVRKELRSNLNRLQDHMKHQNNEQLELEQARQYYEALACDTLHSKLGQMKTFIDEQNKVQVHLDQVRMNNEVQMRTDLQRSMNELTEEVLHLRSSLHQSQLQVEALQDQCDNMQELYNNEVKLRSQLTEDLSKVQHKSLEPFEMKRKNLLKKTTWKTNIGDLNKMKTNLSKTSTGSDDSVLHKLKAELDKSIQRHLGEDFSGNLNTYGTADLFFTDTKNNSIL